MIFKIHTFLSWSLHGVVHHFLQVISYKSLAPFLGYIYQKKELYSLESLWYSHFTQYELVKNICIPGKIRMFGLLCCCNVYLWVLHLHLWASWLLTLGRDSRTSWYYSFAAIRHNKHCSRAQHHVRKHSWFVRVRLWSEVWNEVWW